MFFLFYVFFFFLGCEVARELSPYPPFLLSPFPPPSSPRPTTKVAPINLSIIPPAYLFVLSSLLPSVARSAPPNTALLNASGEGLDA